MSNEFDWSVTINLGYRICSELRGFSKIEEDRANQIITITGELPLASDEFSTKAIAKCTFRVDSKWTETRPVVSCNEAWVKNDLEWHIIRNNLCWEQELHWRDGIRCAIAEATIGNAAEFGKTWLLRSVRNLLNRHLFAHREGIVVWRKEWDFWAHYRAGENEYLRSVKTVNAEK